MKQENGIRRQAIEKQLTRKVKVYDVGKKELIGVFDTATEAAAFTGISPKDISKYVRFKWKNHVNKLNRTICFR